MHVSRIKKFYPREPDHTANDQETHEIEESSNPENNSEAENQEETASEDSEKETLWEEEEQETPLNEEDEETSLDEEDEEIVLQQTSEDQHPENGADEEDTETFQTPCGSPQPAKTNERKEGEPTLRRSSRVRFAPRILTYTELGRNILTLCSLIIMVNAEGPFSTSSLIEFQATGQNVITGYQRAVVLLNYEDPCRALGDALMGS